MNALLGCIMCDACMCIFVQTCPFAQGGVLDIFM